MKYRIALFENCGVKVVGYKTNDGMKVYNALGKLVYSSQAIDASLHRIETRSFTSGIYHLMALSEDGIMQTAKFVVTHN